MNKKGFIATSLIYSFFLIFITLFLTIIADYLQNKVLLNTIENGIKEDINKGMGISSFKQGDILAFQGNNFGTVKFSDDIRRDGTVIYTIYNIEDNCIYFNESKTSSICLKNDEVLTKEPSDSQYITITGVMQ